MRLITGNSSRVDIIEFLKGYSIITIIVFHYLQQIRLSTPYDQIIYFGGTGVHLFLFLSGFGLYYSFLKNPTSYMVFIGKRFRKVYIPYVIVVCITAMITVFIPIFKESVYALAGHVLLFKMFDESIIGSYGYPFWFLSTLFQFYLFFFLIIFLHKRTRPGVFVLISFLISIAWWILVAMLGMESERVWQSFFLQYFWEFALGMQAAALLKRGCFDIRLKRYQLLLCAIGGSILYGYIAYYGGALGRLFNDIPALIGYTSLALWIYSFRDKNLDQFLHFTGKISYSLFLIHILVLRIIMVGFPDLHKFVIFSLSISITYLLAAYYQKVMDKMNSSMSLTPYFIKKG